MLESLHIENYALIEQADLAFGPGLNVLTGETGSGKSIIVDALGLLLGERAESGVVRSGAAAASVTGIFTSPFVPGASAAWCGEHGLSDLGPEIRLRREIAAGRSRAFVDHQLVTAALLRQLARRLGEIHSQNEALVSFTPQAQLRLLDRFAALEPQAAAAAAAFERWRAARDRLADLDAGERERLQQVDLWRFQAGEIAAVAPRHGEDAALEAERSVLAHAERILAASGAAYAHLYDSPEAALAQLKAAERAVSDWSRHDARVAPLLPRLEAARLELDDLAREIQALASRIEAAPQRLAQVEERLAALERLRRKYGPTLDDVLAHAASLAAKLEAVENRGALRQQAQDALAAASDEYRGLARGLGQRRRAAALDLARRLEAEVADLAMTLRFEVAFADPPEPEPGLWTPAGWDRIRFLASTNPGEPLQPVAEIASGGELSRLLLALHLVAEARPPRAASGRKAQPAFRRTLVLDEVDAGIGGRAAEAVGRKLQRLGQHDQVLCVTHLAPIAACAGHHLHVEKIQSGGRTLTRVTALEGKARIAEVARMLAGDGASPTALRHAQELLAARAQA